MDGVTVQGSPTPSTGRRAAAAGALVALLGAAVLVIVSLFDNPVRLIAGLALLGLAVMAGWAALVHRGARRAVAAAVAGLALIGLVVLPLTGSVLRLVVIVALVAISVAAARVALAKDLAGAHDWAQVGPRAGGFCS
jgi:hypothetical protein